MNYLEHKFKCQMCGEDIELVPSNKRRISGPFERKYCGSIDSHTGCAWKVEQKRQKSIYDQKRYTGEFKEKRKEYDRAFFQSPKGKYVSYKNSARVRDIPFDLNSEEFESFWQQSCSYCGSEIETIGLDRVDSSVGYNIDNVIPCCKTCNRMKLDHNTEDFLDHIKRIISHMSGEN